MNSIYSFAIEKLKMNNKPFIPIFNNNTNNFDTILFEQYLR